jgi:hypothetical protein
MGNYIRPEKKMETEMVMEDNLISLDIKIQQLIIGEAKRNRGPTNMMKLLLEDLIEEDRKNFSSDFGFIIVLSNANQNVYDDYIGQGPLSLIKDMEKYLFASSEELNLEKTDKESRGVGNKVVGETRGFRQSGEAKPP